MLCFLAQLLILEILLIVKKEFDFFISYPVIILIAQTGKSVAFLQLLMNWKELLDKFLVEEEVLIDAVVAHLDGSIIQISSSGTSLKLRLKGLLRECSGNKFRRLDMECKRQSDNLWHSCQKKHILWMTFFYRSKYHRRTLVGCWQLERNTLSKTDKSRRKKGQI